MHNVYVRLIIYVLSSVLPLFGAGLAGWGVSYADGQITVQLEAFLSALVAAFGLSGAVFAKWGTR